MKKKNSLSLTVVAVVVLCAVVVLITGLIGFVLSSQSSNAMRTLINERMLDISNTAADMLDGDALVGLSAGDVDTPAYREGMRILRTFYDNIELEFIYCIYDRGNGLYVFGIDPSDDPGAFEDPVSTTPALVAAFDGVCGVDREAYEDAWGVFYSSYSPVFTSDGRVACVVAVDFDANWYNDQLTKQLWIVLTAVFLTLAAGIGMTLMISGRLRSRLRRVNQEAVELGMAWNSWRGRSAWKRTEPPARIPKAAPPRTATLRPSGNACRRPRAV